MNAANPERWSVLWPSATHPPPPGSYERLAAMYAEPHRHYHTLDHIADCLNEFDSSRALAREPVAVELAIWFHDAIYDTRALDNEERSAALAEEWLRQSGAAEPLLLAVRQLILATKTHDAGLHPDAPLLVDIDLSILGQPEERFWQYERQIRAEYSWVPETLFAAKRGEILERFLARSRIYNHERFFKRLENQARANLRASIERLRRGIVSQ